MISRITAVRPDQGKRVQLEPSASPHHLHENLIGPTLYVTDHCGTHKTDKNAYHGYHIYSAACRRRFLRSPLFVLRKVTARTSRLHKQAQKRRLSRESRLEKGRVLLFFTNCGILVDFPFIFFLPHVSDPKQTLVEPFFVLTTMSQPFSWNNRTNVMRHL